MSVMFDEGVTEDGKAMDVARVPVMTCRALSRLEPRPATPDTAMLYPLPDTSIHCDAA